MLDKYIYTPDDEVIEGEIVEGRRYNEASFSKIPTIKTREKSVFRSSIVKRATPIEVRRLGRTGLLSAKSVKPAEIYDIRFIFAFRVRNSAFPRRPIRSATNPPTHAYFARSVVALHQSPLNPSPRSCETKPIPLVV